MTTQAPTQSPLVIRASFVADPLLPPLRALLSFSGVGLQAELGPYHQVFQALLAPGSCLSSAPGGVNLILLRLEDYARDLADPIAAAEAARRVAHDLPTALEAAISGTGRPLLLGILPASPAALSRLGDLLETERLGLLERLQGMPGLVLLRDAEIEIVAKGAREDAEADRLAHIPYVDGHFAALALALARKLHALVVPACKVFVLDCDNTLWRGVVGEDGASGIEMPAGLLALQQRVVALQNEGVLVALASKNLDADVDAVFEQRAEMLLRPEHIVARRVNWQPKPANLRELAAELKLGLDAFVFLDDNPVECAQMRATLPEVITLQLPTDDAAVPAMLDHLWAFDRVAVTNEDRQRTAMYRENRARSESEAAAGSFGEFIASLEMRIDIAAPADDEWARAAQLSQRTNQFNFTTRRFSEGELRTFAANGGSVLRVRVADRFGDYGLVGIAAYRADGDALRVDSFFLSCRVLGRGVEHAMLAHLGQAAFAAGLTAVHLPFRATAKNLPALAFADSAVGAWRKARKDGSDYLIPAAMAASVRYRAGEVPAAVMDALRAADNPAPASGSTAAAIDRSARHTQLATELVDGPAVLRWLHAEQRHERLQSLPAVAAADADEAAMLELWTEVLAIEGLGVEDDFHALGGSSLQAAQLIAAIERRFGPRWPFTTLLTTPTVRALVAKLREGSAPARDGRLVTLRAGDGPRLFLVHDGDGETLLYRNLALRLPGDFGVVGIEPLREPYAPLAHLRIEDMAADYIAAIRALQPQGPYRLGGMCAGGVIAYEMARQLRQAGVAVEFVTLLDAAAPGAPRRAGVGGRSHFRRTLDALRDIEGPPLARGAAMISLLWRRSLNFLSWRIRHRSELRRRQRRMHRLEAVLARQATWPVTWTPLTVREIYEAAERRYRPGPLADVPVLLARATAGDDGDTPYGRIYVDADLGWSRVASARPRLADVAGGHASMLREPHVASLAGVFRAQLGMA